MIHVSLNPPFCWSFETSFARGGAETVSLSLIYGTRAEALLSRVFPDGSQKTQLTRSSNVLNRLLPHDKFGGEKNQPLDM